MKTDPRCIDCKVAMEEGFVPDFAHSAVVQTAWQSGPVEKATFLGLDVGIKASKSKLMPIRTFRCPKCGWLAAFAHPAPKKK